MRLQSRRRVLGNGVALALLAGCGRGVLPWDRPAKRLPRVGFLK